MRRKELEWRNCVLSILNGIELKHQHYRNARFPLQSPLEVGISATELLMDRMVAILKNHFRLHFSHRCFTFSFHSIACWHSLSHSLVSLFLHRFFFFSLSLYSSFSLSFSLSFSFSFLFLFLFSFFSFFFLAFFSFFFLFCFYFSGKFVALLRKPSDILGIL